MKFSYASGSSPLQGYTIKRGIGVGGFGEVYFAISDAGKEVALKKIQRNLDIELRGVRQCLNLNHVNLISLWDIKTNRCGESWVVMEYVPGVSLRDIIESFPSGMPESEIKKWFAATASGVAYLHKHGIVHRDLKPGNIFRDDDQHIVKIGDYGLSKFIACNRRSGHTEVVGTFHYMAPEIGNGVYGKEIDIYALGIVLFEMLTGDVPFNGESSQEIMMKHLTANVPLEKIPPAFHRVMLKSLNKDPRYRYPSVQSMVKELPWRDLASNSESITARYAMGHPSLVRAVDGQSSSSIGYGNAKIAPIFISGESLKILREDVVFGESSNHSTGGTDSLNEDANQPKIQSNPSLQKSTAPYPVDVVSTALALESQERQAVPSTVDRVAVSKKKTFVGGRPDSTSKSKATLEITESTSAIADQMAAGELHPVIDWWAHSFAATVAKLVIVGGLMIVVSASSPWGDKAVFILGTFYVISYMRRHGVWASCRDSIRIFKHRRDRQGIDSSDCSPQQSQHASKESFSQRSGKTSSIKLTTPLLIQSRQGLAGRMERQGVNELTELIGVLLVATLGCIVLRLLPLASSASWWTELSVDDLGRYGVGVATSVFASWVILVVGQFWRTGDWRPVLRRSVMAALGIAVALVGWAASNYFAVELTPVDARDSFAGFLAFQIKGVPDLAGHLIFFALLFGSLRWSPQIDPLRKTRLSLSVVGLCFVWAAVLSYLVGQPAIANGVLVAIVSTSIQLAAAWFTSVRRRSFYLG